MRYTLHFRFIAIIIALCFTLSTEAQNNPWKQVCKLPATNAFYITNSGNMLLADYLFDMNGGIYISTDKGNSWEKTDVQDYNYNYFVENENYIFAAGYSAHIARSADDGLTWEVISYADAVEEELGENLEYTLCYTMAFHDGKLFVGDFSGGGIVYTEDDGETWNKTDIEALSFTMNGKECVENIYNMVSYSGDLYAFGVYFVFRYLPEENSWEVVRDDSNFMAIATVYNNKLCTGRSVPNESTEVPFILTLDENDVWSELPRPEGTNDNNIRAMFADGDDLFVGMQQTGLYFTNDEGLTWHTLNDGIPYSTGYYFTPMFFDSDDEYIYLAAYEPDYSTTENSGLYRLAKSDLPTYDGIENIESNKSAIFNGTSLTFNGNAEHVMICDMNGRVVEYDMNDNIVNLENLKNGVYVYNAVVDGMKVSGKFVIK